MKNFNKLIVEAVEKICFENGEHTLYLNEQSKVKAELLENLKAYFTNLNKKKYKKASEHFAKLVRDSAYLINGEDVLFWARVENIRARFHPAFYEPIETQNV